MLITTIRMIKKEKVMSLGLSIFLYWVGAIVVGGLIGCIAGYIIVKTDEDNDEKE